MTLAMIEQVSDWFCEGVRQVVIAERLGIAPSTVRYHLDKTIRPAWKARLAQGMEDSVVKLEHVERLCFERFAASVCKTKEMKTKAVVDQAEHAADKKGLDQEERTTMRRVMTQAGVPPQVAERVVTTKWLLGQQAWLKLVCEIEEHKAKLFGWLAPQKFEGSLDLAGDFRVAGKSRVEIATMIAHVMDEAKALADDTPAG